MNLSHPTPMKISAIVAASSNNAIGKNNDMPWHMPADLKHFKSITSGHHIIMGRKNYQSIGRPLPNRTNVIITSNRQFYAAGCKIVHSLEDALTIAHEARETEAFIIGGGSIYDLAMPVIDKIYFTEIHAQIEGDVFFPTLSEERWTCVQEEFHPADQKNPFDYTFKIFQRNSSSEYSD